MFASSQKYNVWWNILNTLKILKINLI
jgi:hypothetical protein